MMNPKFIIILASIIIVQLLSSTIFQWTPCQTLPSHSKSTSQITVRDLIRYGVTNKDLPHVLVLGSGGLIGKYLVAELKQRGDPVIEVRGREHLDLRQHHSLDIFDDVNIRFVFFLACEVGGAKYIFEQEQQDKIWDSNFKMYSVVMRFLKERNLPFLFATTSLIHKNITYSRMKRLGEELTRSLPRGKTFRIWNAYGFESIGLKSHVISDWIESCLETGRAKSLTDGTERRQYMYSGDIAHFLCYYMDHFDSIDQTMPLTHGVWSNLHQIAQAVRLALAPEIECNITFSNIPPAISDPVEPNMTHPIFYNETLMKTIHSLAEGVKRTAEQYINHHLNLVDNEPYVSIVVYERLDNLCNQAWLKDWHSKKMLHRENYEILLVSYHKINEGIHEARGYFVAVTSCGVLWSESLIENLSRRRLRKDAYFLVEPKLDALQSILFSHNDDRIEHSWLRCGEKEREFVSTDFILTHRDNWMASGGFVKEVGVLTRYESHAIVVARLAKMNGGLDRVIFEQKVLQILPLEMNPRLGEKAQRLISEACNSINR